MSNLEILLIVCGVSLCIGGSLFLLLPHLKQIGVNVEDVLKKIEAALKGADEAVTIAQEIIPDPRVNILKVLIEEAQKGINRAEQLYISSQISADQRKEKATELITAALNVIGIKITDDIKTLIDGYIDDVIYISKTPEEIKTEQAQVSQKAVNSLQTQISQLQDQNSTLTQENATLKQKLASIQNAATVQVTATQQAQ